MGCRRWVEIALLVVALGASLQVSAATRKQVTMPSPKSVSDNPGGSPTKSVDTLSIPGQPIDGEYLPGINPGKGIKISPIPRIDYSIPTTITLGKNLLKGGGLAGILLGPALQGLLDSVGGLIDEAGDVKKNQPTLDGMSYSGESSNTNLCSLPASQTIGKTFTKGNYIYTAWTSNTAPNSERPSGYNVISYCTSTSLGYQPSSAGYWPGYGSKIVSNPTSLVQSTAVDLSDSDWASMDTFAAGQSAAWLNQLIKDSCTGALDPAGCVEQLKTGSALSGPSSVTGPSTTSTTTYTKPDGTTGTQTTTTTSNFSITYGSDYYDYSKSTVATTSTDGQQTAQTTTTEDASVEQDQQDTPDDYSFTDTEFPTVEPFYEQKYPDGLSGVWQSRSAQVDSSAFVSFLRSFVPSFSGSCPTFGLPLDVGIADFGYRNFDSLCGIFEFVGMIILATAVFTARQLMMGG